MIDTNSSKNSKMKELTKAEDQIMQILWDIEKGFIKDIVEKFEEPKPAYTTVSTIVRILESKGFISHIAYGKTHEYFPQIKKDEYKKKYFKSFLSNYFGNSFKQMVSFFSKDDNLSIKELEELKQLIEKEIEEKK